VSVGRRRRDDREGSVVVVVVVAFPPVPRLKLGAFYFQEEEQTLSNGGR
jgi:hypothetical protein